MKIESISIRNFRCLHDLDLEISDYTALIGPNGSGKSSILYALDWFFRGHSLDAEDWSMGCGDEAEISVAVAFSDVDPDDHEVLGKYCEGGLASFRRTLRRNGDSKIIGRALQGPGFSSVRRPGINAPEAKAAYAAIRENLPELPAQSSRAACEAALDDWEAEPSNLDRLEEIDDADATHLFGATGTGRLSSRYRFVLVPASADLASAAEAGSRSSVLSAILGTITSEAVALAESDWRESNDAVLDTLMHEIESKVAAAVSSPTALVNDHLERLVPGAQVLVEPGSLDLGFKPTTDLRTRIQLDGHATGLDRHGHGVQRAMMIALLQARSAMSDNGANVMFAVEEPEIYQHPVRARHFASVLKQMSDSATGQVLLATHSPYFVDVGDLSCLRRIDKKSASSDVRKTSPTTLAAIAGVVPGKVYRFMANQFGGAFAEAFFADVAVLVEGQTDKAVLEGIAEALGQTPAEAGISIQEVSGKGNLKLAYELLKDLGIPSYVVADGDGHKTPLDPNNVRQTEQLLDWFPTCTPLIGARPSTCGEPTCVTAEWTLFHGDIEDELQGWPGFEAELATIKGNLGDKNAYAYRLAASQAPTEEVPAALKTLVNAIHKLSGVRA